MGSLKHEGNDKSGVCPIAWQKINLVILGKGAKNLVYEGRTSWSGVVTFLHWSLGHWRFFESHLDATWKGEHHEADEFVFSRIGILTGIPGGRR
jgi:hypothetical protein